MVEWMNDGDVEYVDRKMDEFDWKYEDVHAK